MIPAAIVAVLTAWYLGIKAGIAAGVVALVLITVGSFVPGMTLPAWGLVIAWCGFVYFLGPRISKAGGWGKSSLGKGGGLRDNPAMKAARGVGSVVGWAKDKVESVLK